MRCVACDLRRARFLLQLPFGVDGRRRRKTFLAAPMRRALVPEQRRRASRSRLILAWHRSPRLRDAAWSLGIGILRSMPTFGVDRTAIAISPGVTALTRMR